MRSPNYLMNIEIKNISKSFGSIEANKNINLKLKSGIHALLGENGAGKSTLVKIISGQILPDQGNIIIDNNEVILGSPKNSIEKGIGLLIKILWIFLTLVFLKVS